MLYAVKLGPIETKDDSDHFAYIGFTEQMPLPPAMAVRDADGLKQLLQYGQGHELRCEPSLARAGKKLGFTPGPMPVWVMEGRGFLALGMALGPYGGKLDKAGLLPLLAATAKFVKTRPWQWWTDADALAVSAMGSAGKRYEGCITSAGGEEFGLALYENEGAAKRIAAYMAADDFKAASQEPFLSLTLNFEPGWAAEAVDAAYGTGGVPWPMKRTGGKLAPVDATSMAILTAALEATSKLNPGNLLETAEAALEGGRIKVMVEAPAVRVG
jgi:hypothetical protein